MPRNRMWEVEVYLRSFLTPHYMEVNGLISRPPTRRFTPGEKSEYGAGWAPQSLRTVLKKRPVLSPGFKPLIVQATCSKSGSQLFADPLGCAIICHGILG